jgi:hypothetical protein
MWNVHARDVSTMVILPLPTNSRLPASCTNSPRVSFPVFPPFPSSTNTDTMSPLCTGGSSVRRTNKHNVSLVHHTRDRMSAWAVRSPAAAITPA